MRKNIGILARVAPIMIGTLILGVAGCSTPSKPSVLTNVPRDENTPVGTQSVSLEKLGNELKQVFSQAGIELKEFTATNEAMKASAEKLTQLPAGGDEGVITMLRHSVNSDIILLAKVRQVRRVELDNAMYASVSLTLYETGTGRFLAATNWDGSETLLPRSELKGIPGRALREMSLGEFGGRYMSGHLMADWIKLPLITEFQLHGTRDYEETRIFAEAMGTLTGVSVSNVCHDNSIGTFQIEYNNKMKLDDLKNSVAVKALEYPGARSGKITEVIAGRIVWTFDAE